MTAPIGQLRPTGSPNELTEPIYAIEVRNAGGAAVTVEKASIAMKKGITFGLTKQNIGSALPHRLESHSSATFYIDQVNPGMFHDSAQLLHVARPRFRAEVVLGSGDVVASDWTAVTAEH